MTGPRQRLRQGWERLTLYLPVLLMGLLALGSWWLVRNAPKPVQAASERPVLRGTLAQHYPDADTLESEPARMRSVGPDGRVTTARANRALSNADGSQVQLFGQAVVTREPQARAGAAPTPRLEFSGEFLHAWTREERVQSHLPVTLKRGADTFTADRMDYDHLAQVLQLQGRVRGTLMPAPAPAPARR